VKCFTEKVPKKPVTIQRSFASNRPWPAALAPLAPRLPSRRPGAGARAGFAELGEDFVVKNGLTDHFPHFLNVVFITVACLLRTT
jgi:hypothetical protein